MHFAFRAGVFDGIFHQVLQRLQKQRLVGLDRRQGLIGQFAGELNVLLGCLELEGGNHPLHNILYVDRIHLQPDTRFDPPQVEQVVDQARHVFHPRNDLVDVIVLLLIELAYHLEHGSIAAHQGEGRAQVMADRRNKFGFERIELFEVSDVPQDAHSPDTLAFCHYRGGCCEKDAASGQGNFNRLFF